MYHRVARESFDPWGLAVAPEHFEDQLRWLAKYRTVIPLVEFVAKLADGTLPPAAVAVTFDDGYECIATVGAPMLEDAGLPATIFIPAELVERGEPFWWDDLQALVLGHAGESLTVDEEAVPLGAKQTHDNEWKPGAPPQTSRQAAFQRIWAAFREKRPAQLDAAMFDLRRQSRLADEGRVPRPMSPAQVRSTASDLIAFGSHALTHPWLTSLDSDEKAREISESAGRCRKLTGTSPTAFAYPYGNFDAQSERLVKQAGFTCACATRASAVTPKSPLFALPRIQVGNWTAKRLRRALAGVP